MTKKCNVLIALMVMNATVCLNAYAAIDKKDEIDDYAKGETLTFVFNVRK